MADTQDESESLIGKRDASFSSVSYAQDLKDTDNQGDSESFQDNPNCTDTFNDNSNTKRGLNASDNEHRPETSGVDDVSFRSDSIRYAWQNVDAFVTDTASRRSGWGLWGRRETGTKLKKHILKNACGVAQPGELLAIMGSSGAGKSTLLNALMFRSPSDIAVTGRRFLNGVPVSSSTLSRLSAYVQQDDLFIGSLTVREHLVFHALVRMDREIPYKQRMLRVDQVISELGLAKCQDAVIGVPGRIKSVSGGERKRLAIAAEVLTDPPLMFCDEPTSGLDSFMAQSVVAVLKSMARKGKTVVTTIHQPSSQVFAMFDKVLLVAEGRVAFLGTSAQACDFFRDLGAPCPRNFNPAEFFVHLLAVVPAREAVCRETIERVCDKFAWSATGVELAAPLPEIQAKMALTGGGLWGDEHVQTGDDAPRPRSPYKASWWMQFRAVLWRSWLSIFKEPAVITVRVLQTAMMGLVVGFLYFSLNDYESVMNINGVLYIFLTSVTLQSVMSVSIVFGSELPVFKREHYNGNYRVDVYFLSKTLAEAPLFVALPILFTSIAYFLVGLNTEVTRFLIAAAIGMLVANAATSFGYLVSCASSSVSMAVSISPSAVVLFHLFGGYFLNVASVPVYVKWLSYLSWYKYGYEALLINQWEGVDHIDCSNATIRCPGNGHVVLETFNFEESHFALDIWSLVALIVGFRVLAFLALLARTWRKD